MRPDASIPLRVAVDVGPLHGHRTGIGEAVAGIVGALEERPDVSEVRYLVSRRASPSDIERKLPLPGIIASHVWSRIDRPRADRWLADVDVVHGTNYVAPPSRVPTVVSVYDCWFLRHPEAASPLVRRAGSQLRRAVGRGCWIHASSEATADHVRRLLHTDRVTTIHLGPPPMPPAPDATIPLGHRLPVDPDTPFVLAIGTEERRKGLGRLVRAFGDVARRDPDVALVIAGAPGDDSAAVRAEIDSLPAGPAARIHRLGPVDTVTKHHLLSTATVLAYPSLDEGFGFPILEAQHHGIPVVATAVGSIAEVAGDGALLVDGDTPGDLADALAEVLGSDGLRRRLTEAGQVNLRRFSWERTVDALVSLYRHVADPAGFPEHLQGDER